MWVCASIHSSVFPSVFGCLLVHFAVFLCGCRSWQAIKPSSVAWSALSARCCYLRSNPALWPHHQQHTQQPPPPPVFSSSLPPSKLSYRDSRTDTDFPRTSAPERSERKGWRNSAQRRWKKCECNISGVGVMNVISYRTEMLRSLLNILKDTWFLMQPLWGHNIDGSKGKMLRCQTLQGAYLWAGKLQTYIYTHEGVKGKCSGTAPLGRGIGFPGHACPLRSVMLMLLYYFLWRSHTLSLMLLFLPSLNTICQ